jgi:hypothetical protein
MTPTVEPIAAPADRPGGHRRRYLIAGIAAAVMLAGALSAIFTVRHLDHQYGPVQGGTFWGPPSDRGLAFSKDGSSYRLADQPGATAQFITSLDNLGAHSVKVTSIDTGDVATDIRWSVYRTVPGGSNLGVSTPWRRFPAVVPAKGTIRLLITIHHPANCAAYPKIRGISTATYTGDHDVHWESLLHSHTTSVQFYGDDQGIRVC